MQFNTPEEAVAYAMSIQPKPKCFKERISRRIARIGKFGHYPSYCKVTDPLYGKYFIDIQGPFGSDNKGIPDFSTYEEARSYLENMGFKPVW